MGQLIGISAICVGVMPTSATGRVGVDVLGNQSIVGLGKGVVVGMGSGGGVTSSIFPPQALRTRSMQTNSDMILGTRQLYSKERQPAVFPSFVYAFQKSVDREKEEVPIQFS